MFNQQKNGNAQISSTLYILAVLLFLPLWYFLLMLAVNNHPDCRYITSACGDDGALIVTIGASIIGLIILICEFFILRRSKIALSVLFFAIILAFGFSYIWTGLRIDGAKRDQIRANNIRDIGGKIQDYKLKNGKYPRTLVELPHYDTLPRDPKTKKPYLYTLLENDTQFSVCPEMEQSLKGYCYFSKENGVTTEHAGGAIRR